MQGGKMKRQKNISDADYDVVKYENFHEMLKGLHHDHAEKTAIRFRKNGAETAVTYDALIRQVSALYYYFKRNGIQNRNIGILSENRYEYVVIYLACVFDNVAAPMDRELAADDLTALIRKFDIKVLFYTDKTKERLDGLTGEDEIRLFNIDECYQEIIKENCALDAFFKDTERTDSHKFSVLAFTSGTTGAVKGAMLSLGGIVSNLRAPLLHMHLESPMLQLLPMNHLYGFHPDLLSPLYNGDTVCLNMTLKDMVKDFKYYDPYYIGVVPMMLEGLYKIKDLLNKRLRIIVCGGAFLDPVYVDKFDEIGITVLNGYGLTECSPLVSVNRDRNPVRGSAGAVIEGTEVRIADDGEILVKGSNVMIGYYGDKEETDRSFADGYYKTGDLGYLEGDILYVTGRRKNLIILSNGKNFSPEAIEKKLLRLPCVKECLVTAEVRNSAEVIVAKILPSDSFGSSGNDDAAMKLKNYIEEINRTLPCYMRIDDFEIAAEEFKKTSSNKIIR